MPSVSILTPHGKPRIPDPVYNPHLHNRKCSTCGARDRWQRLLDGGWYCCWADAPQAYDPNMTHYCVPLCRGAA